MAEGAQPAVRSEAEDKLVAWLDAHVGGTIERYEKQPRWRGGWWVDARHQGHIVKLYVREEREEDYPPWPLEHEAGALMVLEKHGVPVPHVWGIIPDPHCTVMDALPGDYDFAHVSEAERVAILEDFAEAVARQHAIPPQELVDAIGVPMPQTAEEIALGCFKTCEDMYLKGKKLPEPRVEFLRQWVYRNVPKHRSKVSILSVDSGQFLFQDGKVTGLYDFEYACLGDPLIDVAFIPLRLAMYNAGDTSPFLRRYAELTGETLELEVLAFHATWWGLCTPFILTGGMHHPQPTSTYLEYVGWYLGSILSILQVLSDAKGLDLELEAAPVASKPSRWAGIFDVMGARLPDATEGEPYEVTERRKFIELAKRMDACRDVEASYLEDVERLTGRPVSDWLEADTELERFVQSAGPEHDAALIAVFHRWAIAQVRTLVWGMADMPMFDRHWPRLSRLLP